MQNTVTLSKKKRMEIQLICIELAGKGIAGILRFAANVVFHRSELGTYALVVFFALLVFRYVVSFLHTKSVQYTVITIIGASMLVLASYLLFPENRKYIVDNLPSLLEVVVIGMTSMVLISGVDDWSLVLSSLVRYLRVIVPVLCLTHVIGGASYWGYMSWGLRILPLTLLYYAYIKTQKGILLDKVFFGMSFVFTLFGGRQALVLLIAALFLAELYWVLTEKTSRRTIGVIAVFGIIAYILIFHYDAFLGLVGNLIQRFGINSRALRMLVSNQLLEDSNRSRIYSICLDEIGRNGIAISGLFADRYILGLNGYEGYFAHNFAIEILTDLGLLFGSLILARLLYHIVRVFFRCKSAYKFLYIVMLAIGMGRFFVSGSIFMDTLFWVLVGFLHNKTIRKKRARVSV